MTLLIDLTLGTHQTVFDDLLQLTRCDAGLTTFQPTPFVLGVSFIPKSGSTSMTPLLRTVVDGATNVLLVGVDSTFVFPDGAPITAYAGVTTPGNLTMPITIWYDITDAGGQYYHVHDVERLNIHEPRQVILWHELAHASHMIKGDEPATLAQKEVQAIADENTLRAWLDLPRRHPTDHYGSVGPPSYGGVAGIPRCKEQEGWSPDCIVATAAFGTAHEPRVAELRRAKATYRGLGQWAAAVAEPVLRAYGRFSPKVVEDMRHDPALRAAMLRYAVQPAYHLLQLVETYLAADEPSAALGESLVRRVRAYRAEVTAGAGFEQELADAAAGAAEAVMLLRPEGAGSPPRQGARELPRDLYPYLAGAVAAAGGTTAAFTWAFEGLALYLRHAAAVDDDASGVDLLAELDAWATRPPLPPEPRLLVGTARQELGVVAERLFTRQETRARFADHLLSVWPDHAAGVERLLRELGYTGRQQPTDRDETSCPTP